METEAAPRSRRDRLTHELREYAAIAFYLYICFGAILLYRVSLVELEGQSVAALHGFAIIKALILGKFILILEALRIGRRIHDRPLALTILLRSLILLLALALLTGLEEVVVGLFHGRGVVQSLAGIAEGRWLTFVASSLLMWLILLPYVVFRAAADRLGVDGLRRLLSERG